MIATKIPSGRARLVLSQLVLNFQYFPSNFNPKNPHTPLYAALLELKPRLQEQIAWNSSGISVTAVK